MMLLALSPLGIRLVDSVTTRMPVALHKDAKLTDEQKSENRHSVHTGWREHFENVSASMANGFLSELGSPSESTRRAICCGLCILPPIPRSRRARLRGFIEKSTKANLTGNTFDDAASANGLINFFRLGLDCSAFTTAEVKKATGMSASEIKNLRFGV
jgi:hypothetical protein